METIKMYFAAMAVILMLVSCSDDHDEPTDSKDQSDRELLNPGQPSVDIVPLHVIIGGRRIEWTRQIADELRREAAAGPDYEVVARVLEYGKLEEKIGRRAMEIEKLIVFGPIDDADFSFMKKCVAEGRLRVVDLSKAKPYMDAIPDRAFFAPEYYLDRGEYDLVNPPYLPLYELILPDGLKTIGEAAFANVLIQRIELPQSLQELGRHSFCRTVFLGGELRLPFGVNGIPAYCFSYSGDGSLTFDVPSTAKIIGPGAFLGADIREVTLAEGVEQIMSKAFNGVKGMETFTFPESMKNLEEGSMCCLANLKIIKSMSRNPFFAAPYGIDGGASSINTPFGSTGSISEESITPHSVKVFIPKGTKVDYEAAAGWSSWFYDFIEE